MYIYGVLHVKMGYCPHDVCIFMHFSTYKMGYCSHEVSIFMHFSVYKIGYCSHEVCILCTSPCIKSGIVHMKYVYALLHG